MNKVFPSSPKAQLAVADPASILPNNFPSGLMIKTPPGPVAHKLPSLSTLNPSGAPFQPFLANGPAS